ncbi:MAG: nucleotidyl transferase AbiEii/AbiGii toxin family protein [Candidatus Omnitrophota bacterium]
MIDVIKQQFTEAMPRHVRLNKTREFLQVLCLKITGDRSLFDRVAFLGGTALRMMFQLRRFSEDLDFSVLKAGDIDVAALSAEFVKDLRLYGFETEAKVQTVGAVRSIMFKFPGLLKELGLSALKDEKLAIKWDVDTNPPQGGVSVSGMMSRYFTFRVVHYDLPSLFARKLHACLFRKYAKGRDWYDFIWYVSKKVRPNLTLLKNAVLQTEKKDLEINETGLGDFLIASIKRVDFKMLRKDVERFLEDPAELSIFDRDAITQTIRNNYAV